MDDEQVVMVLPPYCVRPIKFNRDSIFPVESWAESWPSHIYFYANVKDVQ